MQMVDYMSNLVMPCPALVIYLISLYLKTNNVSQTTSKVVLHYPLISGECVKVTIIHLDREWDSIRLWLQRGEIREQSACRPSVGVEFDDFLTAFLTLN